MLVRVCVFLVLVVSSCWAGEKYPFRIEEERSAGQAALVAQNFGHAPVSVAVGLHDLRNVSSDRAWPVVVVVPPASRLVLGRLFATDTARGWSYRYVSQSTLGALGAAYDPATLYRLPYGDGAAYRIGQAPGGPLTTHDDAESRYAIDFEMPEGTPVVAARDGVIIEAEGGYTEGGKNPALAKKANAIRILHADGTIGTYAHLRHQGIAVQNGQRVGAGEIIGYAGSTGYSNGPHLHFAVTHLDYRNAAFETVSDPIRFYVGSPPVPFAAAYGMRVMANYSPADGPAGFMARRWWVLALVVAGLSLLALSRKLR